MWITLKYGGQGCFLVSRAGDHQRTYYSDFRMTLKWKRANKVERTNEWKYNRAIWLVYRTDTNARGFWLVKRTLGWKKLHARDLSRNQSILRFYIILQHHWPIEQCFLHIGVSFGRKTKRACFDLFIHWLIKQITNTYRNHFSRSYDNRSIKDRKDTEQKLNHQWARESIAGCWGKGRREKKSSAEKSVFHNPKN